MKSLKSLLDIEIVDVLKIQDCERASLKLEDKIARTMVKVTKRHGHQDREVIGEMKTIRQELEEALD